VRHQTEYVASFVAHGGHIADRAVGVEIGTYLAIRPAVSQHNLMVAFETAQLVLSEVVTTLAVSNRHTDYLAGSCRAECIGPVLFYQEIDPLTSEGRRVGQQRAGQQSRFDQRLKSVAGSYNLAAGPRKVGNRPHYWRESSYCARSQVIAIGKSAGQYHTLGIAQFGGVMPDILSRLMENLGNYVEAISIAIGAREDDDRNLQ
jgi:hypothetical protein